MIRLFSSDAQVIRLGSTVLRMVAVSEPFYGVPIVIEGMDARCGENSNSFIFNVSGNVGCRFWGLLSASIFLDWDLCLPGDA